MWNGHNCQDIFTEGEHLLWREKSIHPSSQEVSLAHGLLLVGHAQNTLPRRCLVEILIRFLNHLSQLGGWLAALHWILLIWMNSSLCSWLIQISDVTGSNPLIHWETPRVQASSLQEYPPRSDILTRETMSMTHVSLLKWTLQEQQLLAVQCCLPDTWY